MGQECSKCDASTQQTKGQKAEEITLQVLSVLNGFKWEFESKRQKNMRNSLASNSPGNEASSAMKLKNSSLVYEGEMGSGLKSIPKLAVDDVRPLIMNNEANEEIRSPKFPEEEKHDQSMQSSLQSHDSNSIENSMLSGAGSYPSREMEHEKRPPFTFQTGSVYEGEYESPKREKYNGNLKEQMERENEKWFWYSEMA